jgi:hypothetical protein
LLDAIETNWPISHSLDVLSCFNHQIFALAQPSLPIFLFFSAVTRKRSRKGQNATQKLADQLSPVTTSPRITKHFPFPHQFRDFLAKIVVETLCGNGRATRR